MFIKYDFRIRCECIAIINDDARFVNRYNIKRIVYRNILIIDYSLDLLIELLILIT